MKVTITLLAGAAVMLAPAIAFAAPGTGRGASTPSTSAAPLDPGQPNASCEEAQTFPGQADQAPGGGSPFTQGESVAGSHYAGEQLQNTINDHTVSQYDVACANQPSG
jgi:hypothetical protein